MLKSYEFNFTTYNNSNPRGSNVQKVGFNSFEEVMKYYLKEKEKIVEDFKFDFETSFAQEIKGLVGVGIYLPDEKSPKQLAAIWLTYCGNAIRN